MACNCKANRQIYELGKRYGTTVNATRKDKIKSGAWVGVQHFFLGLVSIILSPVLFFIVFWKSAVKKEKVLHLDQMIGLSRK